MTAAAMAAFELRAGKACIRKLADATGDFGSGVVVEGILNRAAVVALLANGGAMARDVTFDLWPEDLGVLSLGRGTAVTITPGAPVGAATIAYKVRSVEQHHEWGTLQLVLEKASP